MPGEARLWRSLAVGGNAVSASARCRPNHKEADASPKSARNKARPAESEVRLGDLAKLYLAGPPSFMADEGGQRVPRALPVGLHIIL